jgi:hypothetical protein
MNQRTDVDPQRRELSEELSTIFWRFPARHSSIDEDPLWRRRAKIPAIVDPGKVYAKLHRHLYCRLR